MSRWRAYAVVMIVPVLFVALGAYALAWWEKGAPPGFRPTPVDVAPSVVTLANHAVRMRGTAHYLVRIQQRASNDDGKPLPGAVSWWTYPLFDPGETSAREIHVLVRTLREPDPGLGFEEVEVEGTVEPPYLHVPERTERLLRQGGYSLARAYVVVVETPDAHDAGAGCGR